MAKKSRKAKATKGTVADAGKNGSNAVKGVNPARGEVDAAIARSVRDTRGAAAAGKPLGAATKPLKPPKKLGRTPRT